MKLFIDTENRSLVKSKENGTPFRIPTLSLGDRIALEVSLLAPKANEADGDRYDTVNPGTQKLLVSLGAIHGTESGQPYALLANFTKDSTSHVYSGTLNLDTAALSKIIAQSENGSADVTLEIRLVTEQSSAQAQMVTVYQAAVRVQGDTVRKVYYNASAPSSSDYNNYTHWVDTDDSYKVKVHNSAGTGWEEMS